jgi:hypothetical protein
MKIDIRTEWWKVKVGQGIAWTDEEGAFGVGEVIEVEPKSYTGELVLLVTSDRWLDYREVLEVYVQEPEVMQVLKEELLK